ncbi:MAG: SH3 domain-containing protein, partial [Devosia sp.]
IPVGCLMTGSCKPPATPAEAAVAKLHPPAPAGTEGAVQMVKPVVQKAAPSLSHNDVLAATFAQLKVDLQPPIATTTPNSSTATVATATPAKGKVNPDSGLTTRMVRAVTVNPDGTPNLTGMAEAYADSSKPIVPRSPAVEAAARIGAGQMPVIEAEAVAELKPAKTNDAKAAAGAGNATVLGAGANVRVSPGKSGRVLFALNGGERVTVLDSSRGWLKIQDDQGRIGWIFSDGVTRG